MLLRTTPRRGSAYASAVLMSFAASACIAVLDPDAYLRDAEPATSSAQGGGASTTGQTTSTAQGQGGATASTSSSGGGSGGSGGGCVADLESDPENCGACGWRCGPGVDGEGACVDGVCAPYRIDTDATSSLAPIGGKVVRVSTANPVQEIELRDADFIGDAPQETLDVADAGILNGSLGKTIHPVGDKLIFFSNAPVEKRRPVLFCDLDGTSCDNRDLQVSGVSQNLKSVALVGGNLYWTFGTADSRVWSVDATDCAAGNCVLEEASGAWANAFGNPSSMRVQALDGQTKLWWSMFDGGGGSTCIHAWDTSELGATVPCVVEDTEIFTLVAAGPNVFYSTDVAGAGLIQRIVPDDGGAGFASGIINLSVRHPLEVDADLLYAYSGADTDALIAARPRAADSLDLDEVGRVELEDGERPVHLEASHPDYLFFTTCAADEEAVCLTTDPRWRLYRWRKPAPPVE